MEKKGKAKDANADGKSDEKQEEKEERAPGEASSGAAADPYTIDAAGTTGTEDAPPTQAGLLPAGGRGGARGRVGPPGGSGGALDGAELPAGGTLRPTFGSRGGTELGTTAIGGAAAGSTRPKSGAAALETGTAERSRGASRA